jgi:UDP-2,3-diacylglucosamine pyrophosphatase LpxH
MKYKTVFISDIHLGSFNSNPEKIMDFLKENEFEKIYLVGDIVDLWAIKRKVHWKTKHNKFVQKILKLSKTIPIIYIVGNHDIELQAFVGENFGNIQIKERDIYNDILVIHGHQFDGPLKALKWIYWLGNWSYNALLWINKHFEIIYKLFSKKEFSLSYYMKSKVKHIVSKITQFETLLVTEAGLENCKMVICGHIHISDDRMINDIRYMNCGCCTEYSSCIVEKEDGEFQLIKL